MGPTRSREVVDQLLAHPLLDGGQVLGDSEVVLVSLLGGPDLAMAEVNRVMGEIKARCAHAQLIMGAALHDAFRERLAVMIIAAREAAAQSNLEGVRRGETEQLDTQLLDRFTTVRPSSRFVPPPPLLPPEKVQQMLARQGRAGARLRKLSSKMRQGQLPLEIVSKGRFDKSEPTIHKGEDLDVPTYIRRGVCLN
jgi:cell division protein FtsZ